MDVNAIRGVGLLSMDRDYLSAIKYEEIVHNVVAGGHVAHKVEFVVLHQSQVATIAVLLRVKGLHQRVGFRAQNSLCPLPLIESNHVPVDICAIFFSPLLEDKSESVDVSLRLFEVLEADFAHCEYFVEDPLLRVLLANLVKNGQIGAASAV